MTQVMPRINSYLQDFAGRNVGEGGDGPAWLQGLRAAAGERFEQLGFPTRRVYRQRADSRDAGRVHL